MAFPSAPNDLKLSAVLTAYDITTGEMNDLRGKNYSNPSSPNTQTVPLAPNVFNLSIFRGSTPVTGRTLPDVTTPGIPFSKNFTISNITYNIVGGSLTSFSCTVTIDWAIDSENERISFAIKNPESTQPYYYIQEAGYNLPGPSPPWTVQLSSLNITDGIILFCGAGNVFSGPYFNNNLAYTLTPAGLTGPVISPA